VIRKHKRKQENDRKKTTKHKQVIEKQVSGMRMRKRMESIRDGDPQHKRKKGMRKERMDERMLF